MASEQCKELVRLQKVRLMSEAVRGSSRSSREDGDQGAPEAATYLRQRQQLSTRHAHRKEALHRVNARKVQTPSFAEVLGQSFDVILAQRKLERAPRERRAQKWHFCRKGPRRE
eukprot:5796737-Pyramimonas_sp.AAC.1